MKIIVQVFLHCCLPFYTEDYSNCATCAWLLLHADTEASAPWVHFCYFVSFTKLKKESWRDYVSSVNNIAQDNFENSEMGQLCAYLFGTIIPSILTGQSLNRLLGIFVEGRKVCHKNFL